MIKSIKISDFADWMYIADDSEVDERGVKWPPMLKVEAIEIYLTYPFRPNSASPYYTGETAFGKWNYKFSYRPFMGDWQEVIGRIKQAYRYAYAREAETSEVEAGLLPGMLNRNATEGEFRIWGHDITDLIIEGLKYEFDGGVLRVMPDIGS